MRLFSKVMLIGVVVVLTNFQGTRSFTLDRNVDNHDSLENTTDGPFVVDSLEHDQNRTSTEDDRIDSVESLKNQTSVEDVTNDSLEMVASSINRNVVPIASSQDNGQLFDFDSVEDVTVGQSVDTPDISNEIETTTIDDDLFDDLVDSMETVKNSTEDLADDNVSLEKNDKLLERVALREVSVFNHLPVIRVFSHPSTRSFTLDRNVDNHDSLENTTDGPFVVDSHEHDQNRTSTEDDRIDSVESLKNKTSVEDVTDDSLEMAGSLIQRNVVPIASSQNNAQLFDFDSVEDVTVGQSVDTPDISNEIETTTIDDDLFDDLVDSMETMKNSTEDLADDNVSLEDNNKSLERVALRRVSVFDHLPVIGVFSHPSSDDLYIAKQYMGDYYVWEMGDDSAREYFTQPGKGFPKANSDSPIKVKADQFAGFTPVRSLPDQRPKTVV
ncbi:uncharacterized protein LOC130693118 [Daphnia carinata]|uniref:uncharacterized protein LOC130693118 n=1 Tax=Daphnia carinata TaxID=120202 RepID=UPI00257BAF9C|nr:uncharacterized protein LOC130693118 [Daphnia carinata]